MPKGSRGGRRSGSISDTTADKIYDIYDKNNEHFDENIRDSKGNFEFEQKSYAPYQEGTANKDNFFEKTIAHFTSVDERPDREPDYVSKDRYGNVSSEYWYTKDGVIRGSDHWGFGVSSCDWALDDKYGTATPRNPVKTSKSYGKAKWSDFTQKTNVLTVQETGEKYASNFKNYLGDFTYKIKGKKYKDVSEGAGILRAI